jgi:hypothetical protein
VTEATGRQMELRHLEPEPYACRFATTIPRKVGAELHRIRPQVGQYLGANGYLRAACTPPLY